jgi:hypothetical protein
MKRIEKMAKEHVAEEFRPDATDLIKAYSQSDYEAGFRAAREMAAEACEKVGKIARHDETMTEWSKNAAAFRIMGEEEV